MKHLFVSVILLFLLASCGGGEQKEATVENPNPLTEEGGASDPAYDAKRGEGKFKDVQIDAAIDKQMAESGKQVYELKCSSCHKTTDERLVGPGWKGVTSRRTAAWIMNFATNTEEMIDKDPEVQAQLEICLVRMPNQNLTDDDARNVYEFMRDNDAAK
jgi:mono/diheme cytochrome c family protein